jgi:hypothetical protein
MATSDLLVGGGYDGVLALGDEQYESGALADFQGSYEPSWGRVKAATHPVAGNQEYEQPGANGYFSYFGAAAGDPRTGYYAFDLGAWRLYALNSNCAAVSCAAGSSQETWLRNDLAAHPGGCQLAFWHHPLFNSGTSGQTTAVRPLYRTLAAAGVDAVLVGHDHHYERFAPQDANGAASAGGPREFIVGTGGASHGRPRSGGTVAPNSQVRNYDTFGILELTLRSGDYDWRFAPEAGGAFTDAGTQACH